MKLRHTRVFLVKSEKELRELFCGSGQSRIAPGDDVVLVRPIVLTADITIPCAIRFLIPPNVSIHTQGHAIQVGGRKGSAVMFCPLPRHMWNSVDG